MKGLYRIEGLVSKSGRTLVWRSYYGTEITFPRNEAISRASKLRRIWKGKVWGRLRIRRA